MTTRPLTAALRTPLGARRAAVAAAALPFLFLHVEYQPSLSIPFGATTLDVRLSDLAVALVVGAAIADGRARGFEVLRAGRWVWMAAAGLALWVVAGALYGPLVLDDYPFAENVVTAAKFVEYALLAPAAALLVRTREDLRVFGMMLVAWSALATAVGLLQLAGSTSSARATRGGSAPSSDTTTSPRCRGRRSCSGSRPSCSRTACYGSRSRPGRSD